MLGKWRNIELKLRKFGTFPKTNTLRLSLFNILNTFLSTSSRGEFWKLLPIGKYNIKLVENMNIILKCKVFTF